MSIKYTVEYDDFKQQEESKFMLAATDSNIFIAGEVNSPDLMEAAANTMATVFKAVQQLENRDPNNQKDMFECLTAIMYNAYSIITKQVDIAHSKLEYEKDGQTYLVDMPAIMQQMLEGKLRNLFKDWDEEEEEEDE